MFENITLETLDEKRKEGFRPGVVGCFVNDEKILLFFKRDYNLWMLPQGGINNGEDMMGALKREMKEEVGEKFIDKWISEPVLIMEDEIEFNKKRHGDRELKTDAGEEVMMIGKYYYYLVIPVEDQEIDISETEFDEAVWVDYRKAMFLAKRIYQTNKRDALIKVLSKMKEKGFIELDE